MTSQPSEQNHIQHTLSLGVSHAKIYPKQGTEKAFRRLQGLVSGLNSSEPYAWYDQSTSSWKTYQRSLLTEWTSFSETFSRQGYMNANGAVFQVALLGLATKEIDGFCWDSQDPSERAMLPTPTTMDHLGQRSPEALKRQMEGPRKGRTSLSNLREAVNPRTQEIFNSLLPTPRASDMEGGIIKDAKFKNGSFYRENKKGEKFGIKLRDAVTLLPTPTATDYKGRSGQGFIDRHGKRRIPDVLTQTGDNTYLNPQFVEEMMGFPVGWTDVKDPNVLNNSEIV